MSEDKTSAVKAVKTETIYLDKYGRPCEMKQAFKRIVREYDDNGNIVKTYLSIDPQGTGF